jgi:hypothetical protein
MLLRLLRELLGVEWEKTEEVDKFVKWLRDRKAKLDDEDAPGCSEAVFGNPSVSLAAEQYGKNMD